MTKLDIAKSTASMIVALGTSTIAGSIIRNNVAPKNTLEKVTVLSASFVIGSMSSHATTTYTETKIDAAADWWKNHVKN